MMFSKFIITLKYKELKNKKKGKKIILYAPTHRKENNSPNDIFKELDVNLLDQHLKNNEEDSDFH